MYNRMRPERLPFFEPNLELCKLFEPEFLCPKKLSALSGKTRAAFHELVRYYKGESALSETSYQRVLSLLTEVEDALVQVKLEPICLVNKKLELEKNRMRDYKLYINVAEELPPEVGDGDYVVLRTMHEAKYNEDNDTRLSITRVNETFLEVRTSQGSRKMMDTKVLYEVKFQKDRTVFRFEQQAILTVHKKVIERALFPEKCGNAGDPSISFEWLSTAVKTNPEQQQAVRNIVNGSSFPAPYILFGPPGTGKTTTLVEAIAQVWKMKPDTNILVCASSNYACDEILSRLLDLNCIPVHEMFRYLSKSQLRKTDTIDERILEISNITKDQEYVYPELTELLKYRVMFVTLVTAGRLALNRVGTDHFDYIFIDEAGSATEASTLIPIAGLVSYAGLTRPNHIVIAGDPKQLGPIVLHRPAEKLMYGRSLLDRLMELDLYKPSADTKEYNEACITKLLQNFRSHKNILDIPNRLFYDNQLIAKAKADITNTALGQRFLPNKKIPIVFHAVSGETLQDDDNPSLYNKQECEIVMQYLAKIMRIKNYGVSIPQKEIGIISPYRRQCIEITKMLRHRKLTEIEVGSVEQFQGQERAVIILSTVRSNTSTIGFLNNPKRLNVSITRAKALLIIVGNPKTLQLDKNWHELIKYCVNHGVCTGIEFSLKKPVRGRFKAKFKPSGIQRNVATDKITNGFVNDQLSPALNNVSISDKIKRETTKQRPSYTVLMHYNEKNDGESASSSASPTEIESSDTESSLNGELENDIMTDDEIEANFQGTHFLNAQDVFTTDESEDNEDTTFMTINQNDNSCDNNNETVVTNENVKEQSNDNTIFDLDFHFDTFGFVN